MEGGIEGHNMFHDHQDPLPESLSGVRPEIVLETEEQVKGYIQQHMKNLCGLQVEEDYVVGLAGYIRYVHNQEEYLDTIDPNWLMEVPSHIARALDRYAEDRVLRNVLRIMTAEPLVVQQSEFPMTTIVEYNSIEMAVVHLLVYLSLGGDPQSVHRMSNRFVQMGGGEVLVFAGFTPEWGHSMRYLSAIQFAIGVRSIVEERSRPPIQMSQVDQLWATAIEDMRLEIRMVQLAKRYGVQQLKIHSDIQQSAIEELRKRPVPLAEEVELPDMRLPTDANRHGVIFHRFPSPSEL